MIKKAIIIGSSGAGKSTFARKLRDKTGLPLFYLDSIWHKADKTTVTQAQFDFVLEKILVQEEWIIDGNFQRTMERRLEECDTVFFFDLPLEDCLAGVEMRIGKPREDMPWIETEFDEEFRKWIIDFHKNTVSEIRALLGKCRKGRNIIVFTSWAQADEFLASENFNL